MNIPGLMSSDGVDWKTLFDAAYERASLSTRYVERCR